MKKTEFLLKINKEYGLPFSYGDRLGKIVSYDYEKARMVIIFNPSGLEAELSNNKKMNIHDLPFCSKIKSDDYSISITCPCCDSVFYINDNES